MSKAHKGKQYALGTVRSLEFRQKLSNYWAANPEKHNNFKDGRYAERMSAPLGNEQTAVPVFGERLCRKGRLDMRRVRPARGQLAGSTTSNLGPEHPALRYDVDNGRTLCVLCHKKTDTYCRSPKGIAA